MKKESIDLQFIVGIICLLLWFIILPDTFKNALFKPLQNIGISSVPLSGIINYIMLFIACVLCHYSFRVKFLSIRILYKQIVAGIVLLGCILLCSLLFLEYTVIFQGNGSLIEFIINQIIFVGLYEELLFRGVLIFILKRFLTSNTLVICLSAILFACSHIGSDVFSILQITTSFIIGIIFALLIEKFPNYFSVFNIGIVHGIFNIMILGFTTFMVIK